MSARGKTALVLVLIAGVIGGAVALFRPTRDAPLSGYPVALVALGEHGALVLSEISGRQDSAPARYTLSRSRGHASVAWTTELPEGHQPATSRRSALSEGGMAFIRTVRDDFGVLLPTVVAGARLLVLVPRKQGSEFVQLHLDGRIAWRRALARGPTHGLTSFVAGADAFAFAGLDGVMVRRLQTGDLVHEARLVLGRACSVGSHLLFASPPAALFRVTLSGQAAPAAIASQLPLRALPSGAVPEVSRTIDFCGDRSGDLVLAQVTHDGRGTLLRRIDPHTAELRGQGYIEGIAISRASSSTHSVFLDEPLGRYSVLEAAAVAGDSLEPRIAVLDWDELRLVRAETVPEALAHSTVVRAAGTTLLYTESALARFDEADGGALVMRRLHGPLIPSEPWHLGATQLWVAEARSAVPPGSLVHLLRASDLESATLPR